MQLPGPEQGEGDRAVGRGVHVALIDGYVAFGPFVPGWKAVPMRVAVSVIGLPKITSAPADVVSAGVTGSTSKHSPSELSVASSTPRVFGVEEPPPAVPTDRRQVGEPENTGMTVSWFTAVPVPISRPPVSQVPVAIGPHRKKCSVPLHVSVPSTVRSAESVTSTPASPVPIWMSGKSSPSRVSQR